MSYDRNADYVKKNAVRNYHAFWSGDCLGELAGSLKDDFWSFSRGRPGIQKQAPGLEKPQPALESRKPAPRKTLCNPDWVFCEQAIGPCGQSTRFGGAPATAVGGPAGGGGAPGWGQGACLLLGGALEMFKIVAQISWGICSLACKGSKPVYVELYTVAASGSFGPGAGLQLLSSRPTPKNICFPNLIFLDANTSLGHRQNNTTTSPKHPQSDPKTTQNDRATLDRSKIALAQGFPQAFPRGFPSAYTEAYDQ